MWRRFCATWNPGRTLSPTYSTNCESATWNLQNTLDNRFYPTKNTQLHTLLSPPIIMFCNFRRLCRFCRLCKFCRFGRFCNFCRLCRKNAFTYLFDELRIDNLECTKHPRHPFLLHDKYATLLSLHTIRFRNFCRNLQNLQTPQNSQNLQILRHITWQTPGYNPLSIPSQGRTTTPKPRKNTPTRLFD